MASKLKIQDDPHIVFLDTSAIEAENFAFQGDVLSALVASCKENTVALVLTEITVEEVKRRIQKAAKAAHKALKAFKQDARFLGRDREIWPKMHAASYCDDLASTAVSEFDEFISDASALILKTDDVKASNVFRKYFAVKPPFSQAKDKEFPDAFVCEALIQHATAKGATIHVVSADGDFACACAEEANLVLAKTVAEIVEDAIGWSLATSQEVILACHEWVDSHFREISDRIEAAVKAVEFDVDAPAGRVISFEIQNVELVNQHVIQLDETHAVISAPTSVSIQFAIEYDEAGDDYYDADDRLIIPYEFVARELDVNIDFNVVITADIEMPYPTTLREVKVELPSEFMITPNETEYTAIV